MKPSTAVPMMMIVLALCPLFVLIPLADHKEKLKPLREMEILSSLDNADAWVKENVRSANLKGKVVLVEFGTYTCINWLRTLPYVRAWYEKYKEKGLVVIGVHTPEFPFEKNIDNVRRAVNKMNIDFPMAIDNKQRIWTAFNNQYWPAFYLIDSKGHIQYHHFGEGNYEGTEKMIKQLLGETGIKDLSNDPTVINANGIEMEADWNNLKSAENYLGYERTENFASNRIEYDKQHNYKAPSDLFLNQWAISGEWTMQQQSILLNKAGGKIVYRFRARDCHLVMGSSVAGTPIRFRVLINGKTPGDAHGADIDEKGNGTITSQRLYQLIRQSKMVTDCEIEIELLDNNAEAFAFTFG